MNRVRIEELADELARDILKARAMMDTDGKIHAGIAHYDIREEYCPKYISEHEYSDLANLNEFLKYHPEINNKDLKEIFKKYNCAFRFYRKLTKHFDDLTGEMRQKGIPWIVTNYCGDLRFKELCKLAILE